MEQKFTKIAILGLGLIGGSLGKALVRRGFVVSGWDVDAAVRVEARENGAVNYSADTLEQVLDNAGVVFIAVPALYVSKVIEQALPFVAAGAVFSDVCSTKGDVIREVQQFLPKEYAFVPGHPMTGSERNGIAAADPFLFENAAYILIDLPETASNDFEKIQFLIETIGAHLIRLTADEHDRIVSVVSHLPHMVAAMLARTAGEAETDFPGTLALAAGGFRDTTRIAMGDPQLWSGILQGNRTKILEALNLFRMNFDYFENLIKENKSAEIKQFLQQAKDVRVQIPTKNKGFVSMLHEIVVTIEDRPGTIQAVLQYLSAENINVKDIEILRIREGDGGTLRLALEEETDLEKSLRVLEKNNFKAWRR